MKHILLVVWGSLISLTVFSQSDSGSKPNIVKFNPLGLLFGSGNLAYERALNAKSSVVVAPSFGFLKSGDFKYSTYGLGLEYRFYLSKTKSAPEGIYAAPGVGYVLGTAKSTDPFSGVEEKTNVSTFTGKAVFGYQWVWDSGLVLDLNGGFQYLNFKFKDNTGVFSSDDALSGLLPALAVSIGYNF